MLDDDQPGYSEYLEKFTSFQFSSIH